MKTFFAAAITTCAFVIKVGACLGPTNIEGVSFTTGETLHVEKIAAMGAENVNYFKDGTSPNAGFRYKSHYDPKAMVFVGDYGISYQQNMHLSCMGVILPNADSASIAAFDFAKAVKTELEWLVDCGVVVLPSATIQKIDSLLSRSSRGGLQYWTHGQTVLGYNSWYERDSATGKWSYNGVDGVRSPNGMDGLDGCSVIKPGTGLPPSGLVTTSVTAKPAPAAQRMRPLIVRQLGSGGLLITFPQITTSEATIAVVNAKGGVVRMQRVPAAVRSVCIDGLAFGKYSVRVAR
jgi:hypothetical protein